VARLRSHLASATAVAVRRLFHVGGTVIRRLAGRRVVTGDRRVCTVTETVNIHHRSDRSFGWR